MKAIVGEVEMKTNTLAIRSRKGASKTSVIEYYRLRRIDWDVGMTVPKNDK